MAGVVRRCAGSQQILLLDDGHLRHMGGGCDMPIVKRAAPILTTRTEVTESGVINAPLHD